MANEGVYMDIPVVEDIVKGFSTVADTMKKVSKALEIAIQALKVAAFFGIVGAAVLEKFLSAIKPIVDQIAAKCEELSKDVNDAIKAYRDGDLSGSKHFQG